MQGEPCFCAPFYRLCVSRSRLVNDRLDRRIDILPAIRTRNSYRVDIRHRKSHKNVHFWFCKVSNTYGKNKQHWKSPGCYQYHANVSRFLFPHDINKDLFSLCPLLQPGRICFLPETTLHWYSHSVGFRKVRYHLTLGICQKVRLLCYIAKLPYPSGISCAIFWVDYRNSVWERFGVQSRVALWRKSRFRSNETTSRH